MNAGMNAGMERDTVWALRAVALGGELLGLCPVPRETAFIRGCLGAAVVSSVLGVQARIVWHTIRTSARTSATSRPARKKQQPKKKTAAAKTAAAKTAAAPKKRPAKKRPARAPQGAT